MNKFNNISLFIPFLSKIIFSFMLFVFTFALVVAGLGFANNLVDLEGEKYSEEAILHAAISCYALEGVYPEKYEYLRDNYGISINEEIYIVHYSVFASNIMPEITVVRRRLH